MVIEMIKVSIVIPIYNTAKYLDKCLTSVITQSYQNIEIILVNDGSTDDCKSICDNYAKKDKRIIVLNQKNSGVSASRNNGIKVASGKYLCFLDSDDFIHPDYVQCLINNIKENTLSVCQMETFKNDVIPLKNIEEKKEFDRYHFIYLSSMYLLNTPCCKLYNLDVIKTNKIYFDTGLSLGEDLMFNLNYMQYIDKIIVDMQKLYYYRKDDNLSLSTSYNPKMFDIQLLLYDSFTKFFIKTKMQQEELCIFDSFRFSTLKIIVENEFRNKKISFWQRYINTRKVVRNKEIQKRLKEIRYPKKKVFCFLIRHNLILLYKIMSKIKTITQ